MLEVTLVIKGIYEDDTQWFPVCLTKACLTAVFIVITFTV